MTLINTFRKNLLTGSSIFIFSTLLANFLNFFYNAYLGRVLTVENFGLVTFINTLMLLSGIFISAFGSAVTHRVAYLVTHVNKRAGLTFVRSINKNIFTLSLFLMLVWVLLIPFSSKFFYVGDITSLLFFTPVISLFLNATIMKGFLSGNLYFISVSIALLAEALSKLLFAVLFKFLHLENYIYLSIPLSLFVSFIFLFVITRFKTDHQVSDTGQQYAFPRRFYAASLISGLATSGFLTLDLILVKHYLLPSAAGEYALLSLAGKMIFFFGSIFNGLILTYVSRDLGAGKNPIETFYKFLWLIIGMVTFSYIGIGLFGGYLMPIAFGAKVLPIIPYLKEYCLAIALFTLSNAFVVYHLTRHHYSFSALTFISAISMILGMYLFHSNIGEIIRVIFYVSFFNFLGIISLHVIKKDGAFILRNLIDLADIFSVIPNQKKYSETSQRILIFNWRDTKHKFAGGAEVYIHELAKRWVTMGYSVTQFCGNDGNAARNEVVDGIQIVRRGGFYFVYFWAFWYYVLRFRGKYDVIIDTQNGIPFFTPLYAKEQVYCLMFHVHQEVFRSSLSKPLAAFASILENRLMPWAYEKTKFITISPSSKAEILSWDLGKTGIEIIYPGIDLKTFKPTKYKSSKPLIIYIGRLQLYKSVDVLIRSASKIFESIPNAELIIAGDGEEKHKLEALSEKLGHDKRIKFLGKISEEEKIKLYQKAWVAVNPSLKEGWGITTIEANACGTPVVASNVPGLSDSVKTPETGFLVEYGNIHSLAERIIKIVKDKKTRLTMEKNSINWAQNFDWQVSAERSLKLIKL